MCDMAGTRINRAFLENVDRERKSGKQPIIKTYLIPPITTFHKCQNKVYL